MANRAAQGAQHLSRSHEDRELKVFRESGNSGCLGTLLRVLIRHVLALCNAGRSFVNRTSSGWERYRAGDGMLDYDQGGYRMLVGATSNLFWVNTGIDLADVVVEVDARKLGGPEADRFGLMCRLDSETGDYYFFLISSDGRYGIGKLVNWEPTLIGQSEMAYSDAIEQEGEHLPIGGRSSPYQQHDDQQHEAHEQPPTVQAGEPSQQPAASDSRRSSVRLLGYLAGHMSVTHLSSSDESPGTAGDLQSPRNAGRGLHARNQQCGRGLPHCTSASAPLHGCPWSPATSVTRLSITALASCLRP